MFVRSETHLGENSFRIQTAGKMIMLISIGSFEMPKNSSCNEEKNAMHKVGTVAFLDRFNLRFISLELET